MLVLTDDYTNYKRLVENYPELHFYTLEGPQQTGYQHRVNKRRSKTEKRADYIKFLAGHRSQRSSRAFYRHLHFKHRDLPPTAHARSLLPRRLTTTIGFNNNTAKSFKMPESTTHKQIPLTCYIRTLNEAARIGAVIQEVQKLRAEIIVIDSNSTDATRQIAEDAGATVIVKDWAGQGLQKTLRRRRRKP